MGVVHRCRDVRVRLWLCLLTQIVQLEVQPLQLNLHVLTLLRQRVDFLGCLAPLGLLFEHGLEALSHNVVFMLEAAHVTLNIHELVLIRLDSDLTEVLQRLQHNVMTLIWSSRLVEKIPQLHGKVVGVLVVLPLISITIS